MGTMSLCFNFFTTCENQLDELVLKFASTVQKKKTLDLSIFLEYFFLL